MSRREGPTKGSALCLFARNFSVPPDVSVGSANTLCEICPQRVRRNVFLHIVIGKTNRYKSFMAGSNGGREVARRKGTRTGAEKKKETKTNRWR